MHAKPPTARVLKQWSLRRLGDPDRYPTQVHMSDTPTDEDTDAWYERKSSEMERLLGPEHGIVMHAVIPYALGGGLDLYYYPNGIPGTAIATKELCESPDDGSTNDAFSLYEFVMFTKHTIDLDNANEDSKPFGKAHRNINAILSCIAPYSAQATVNPNETCEFPSDMADVGGKCLIFDTYGDYADAKPAFGLMLAIEIFRDEMDFARSDGGDRLLTELRKVGHYPYSDLDRRPVV